MKKMSFAAKIAGLCACMLLFLVIKLITNVDFTRSERVVLDEKDGYTVFYMAGESFYSLSSRINIETAQQKYENVEISEIILIDLYIGNNQAVMYRTDLPASGHSGIPAVITQSCGSLLEYMVIGNK